MSYRYAAVLVLLLISWLARDAVASRVLDHYDIDSLSAMAGLVIRAEVGDATEVHTRDGDCAVTEMTVLATLKGDAKPQSVIRVAGLDEYRKGPGIEGAEKGYPRVSKGDVVYLFMVAKGTRMGYAMYDLTNADWKIIESGARLVVKDQVHGFGQYKPPGPVMAGPISGFVAMTEKTFPRAPVETIETFEGRVKKSLEFIDTLKRKIAQGSLTPAEREAILRARPAVLEKELAYNDHIPTFIAEESHRAATRP